MTGMVGNRNGGKMGATPVHPQHQPLHSQQHSSMPVAAGGAGRHVKVGQSRRGLLWIDYWMEREGAEQTVMCGEREVVVMGVEVQRRHDRHILLIPCGCAEDTVVMAWHTHLIPCRGYGTGLSKHCPMNAKGVVSRIACTSIFQSCRFLHEDGCTKELQDKCTSILQFGRFLVPPCTYMLQFGRMYVHPSFSSRHDGQLTWPRGAMSLRMPSPALKWLVVIRQGPETMFARSEVIKSGWLYKKAATSW